MTVPPLEPQTSMREDEALPGLPSLFEEAHVWRRFCDQFGEPDTIPDRIKVENFTYRPGRRILISYVLEFPEDSWLVDEQFSVYLRAGRRERVFRFPDDPFLPGLSRAASPQDAHDLLAEHLSMPPRRVLVDTVRYRPGSRAVLRNVVSWGGAQKAKTTLYARVLPPSRLPRLLDAFELMSASRFALPSLVATWLEGGVVWMGEVTGKTLRALVRKDQAPPPERVLDAIAPLWESTFDPEAGRPLNLSGGFDLTQRVLSNVLDESSEARAYYDEVVERLTPFVEGWAPTVIAHNDFHDDQIIVTSGDGLALVDFEEAGPGDPQVDIGNMLGHMAWMALFGAERAFGRYGERLRDVSILRFGWDPHELALRQAYAIFRLSANPVRNMRPDWEQRVGRGLSLARDVLSGIGC